MNKIETKMNVTLLQKPEIDYIVGKLQKRGFKTEQKKILDRWYIIARKEERDAYETIALELIEAIREKLSCTGLCHECYERGDAGVDFDSKTEMEETIASVVEKLKEFDLNIE